MARVALIKAKFIVKYFENDESLHQEYLDELKMAS